jgi:hypothetical protein
MISVAGCYEDVNSLWLQLKGTSMYITHATTPELMDDPGRPAGELRENLRDLERMNRFLGGHAIVRAYLNRALPVWRNRGGAAGAALVVLDVATGGADVPAAVAAWAQRRRVAVRIVGIDRHPTIARLARISASACPEVTVIRADARALPFADASVDVCLCNLALHHLTAEEGLALVQRLHRLSRVWFLIVDLLRSPAGYGGVWLATRFARSPVTRHDGPLSVRRSRSWAEYRQFAAAAAIPGLRLLHHSFFRVSLSRIG